MITTSQIENKHGYQVRDYAVDLCLILRKEGNSTKEEAFNSKMKERFNNLTEEELGFLFNYGMMETR